METATPTYPTIEFEGKEYRVLGLGTIREDGKQYCHLADMIRFSECKNGRHPRQICVWIDAEKTKPASDALMALRQRPKGRA